MISNLNLKFVKTRFFATNSLSFLPECDRIMLLESGQVKEIGTYRELKSSSGTFVEFIGKYFQEHKDSKQTEDEGAKSEAKKGKEKS
jgi:ABC-type multidrug transport system fused ATPase/permease subunit